MFRILLVLKEFYGYNFKTLEDVLYTLQMLINMQITRDEFNSFIKKCTELELVLEDSIEKCMKKLQMDEQNIINNLFKTK